MSRPKGGDWLKQIRYGNLLGHVALYCKVIMANVVFVYSWNTQSCIPNPFDCSTLVAKIIAADATLVVIALQEDATGSGIVESIHAALPQEYTLVHALYLPGWGATTVKAAVRKFTYISRGVHLAIFSKAPAPVTVTATRHIIFPSMYNWLTHGKGAVAITVEFACGFRATFLNVHAPFSSIVNRNEYIDWQAHCVRYACEQALADKNSGELFLLGDLNFRVQCGELAANVIADKMLTDAGRKELLENDELTILKTYAGVLPNLAEGCGALGSAQGPQFAPTFKLHHSRDPANLMTSDYRTGKTNSRAPSWCDRILYSRLPRIECVEYNRIDTDSMTGSDHAGVYGIFTIL